MERGQLIAALRGRADTLTHCPQCGDRAKFAYGRGDNGHEVAGFLFEQPILVCPRAPAGRFVAVGGSFVTVLISGNHQLPLDRAEMEEGSASGG